MTTNLPLPWKVITEHHLLYREKWLLSTTSFYDGYTCPIRFTSHGLIYIKFEFPCRPMYPFPFHIKYKHSIFTSNTLKTIKLHRDVIFHEFNTSSSQLWTHGTIILNMFHVLLACLFNFLFLFLSLHSNQLSSLCIVFFFHRVYFFISSFFYFIL